MDLKQRKLNKSEWDSIEISVSKAELDVLRLITTGYSDVTTRINNNNSIFTFLKIEFSSEIEEYLYNKYFADKVKTIVTKNDYKFIKFEKNKGKKDKKKHDINNANDTKEDADPEKNKEDSICYIDIVADVKLKTKDQIRLSRSENIDTLHSNIYEFVLFRHFEQMVSEKASNNKHWLFHYYTLSNLIHNNIQLVVFFLPFQQCLVKKIVMDFDRLAFHFPY